MKIKINEDPTAIHEGDHNGSYEIKVYENASHMKQKHFCKLNHHTLMWFFNNSNW